MSARIVTLGSVYMDINYPNFPFDDRGLAPETEMLGDDYEMVAGGSAVTVARVSSSLGQPAVCVGKTGDDPPGHMLAKELQAAGVKPQLLVDRTVQTNLSLNLVNAAGQSIMAVAGNANASLSTTEVESHLTAELVTSGYCFIGGCFKLKTLLPELEVLIEGIQKAGVKVVMDHGRLNASVREEDKTIVKRLVGRVDYYVPSAGELQALWGVDAIEQALRQLVANTAAIVVVKDSSQGAVTLVDGELLRIPAFPVRPLHTVGAGDAFNAGFITAQSLGCDLPASLRFASATAALYIAESRPPTRQAVEALLASTC